MQTLRTFALLRSRIAGVSFHATGGSEAVGDGDAGHFEGYGLSITLVPPFKAVRLPPRHRVVSDQLVFAHEGDSRTAGLLLRS